MFNQKGHREREAERRKAELLLDTYGDRDEYQRPHVLRLEDQRAEKHKSREKYIQNDERCIRSDAEGIHSCSDHHGRKVGGIKAGSDHIGTGREDHQVPRNIDVVPFHDTDSRHEGDDGTYEDHHLSRYAVPALGHPHHEHTHEYGNRLIFLFGHLAHSDKLLTEAFHTAFDLRLLFLRLEREYHLHTNEPADKEQDHGKRESSHKPVRVNHRD